MEIDIVIIFNKQKRMLDTDSFIFPNAHAAIASISGIEPLWEMKDSLVSMYICAVSK